MCVVLSHQVGGSLAQQRWAADIVSTLEMGVTVRELGVTKGQEDMCPRGHEGMVRELERTHILSAVFTQGCSFGKT